MKIHHNKKKCYKKRKARSAVCIDTEKCFNKAASTLCIVAAEPDAVRTGSDTLRLTDGQL